MTDGTPSARRALVASESAGLRDALASAGFRVEVVLQPDAATAALAKDPIELVACDESTDRRLVEQLRTLPGRRRRDLFVLFVASECRTGDRLDAWRRSTNLVVHPDDVKNLKRLLEAAMADEEQFYARFRSLSQEVHQVLGSY